MRFNSSRYALTLILVIRNLGVTSGTFSPSIYYVITVKCLNCYYKSTLAKDSIPTGNYLSKGKSSAAGLTPHVTMLIGWRNC